MAEAEDRSAEDLAEVIGAADGEDRRAEDPEDRQAEADEPDAEDDEEDEGANPLFGNLRIQHEPLRNLGDLQEGVTYRSSLRSNQNGRGGGVLGVGPGYVAGADGHAYYEAANGNRHDMRSPAPRMCFNCAHRTDIPDADKYHWRLRFI